MPKLTKTYIDKLTAPADKGAFHWDTEIKGFGLRVTPSGKITYIACRGARQWQFAPHQHWPAWGLYRRSSP